MSVFSRGKKSSGDTDEEYVSLDDADHAWWAGRDDLERAWAPPAKDSDDAGTSGPKRSQFEEEFSAESLFEWADGRDTHAASDAARAPAPDGSDPYAVLGVNPGASWDDIVAAHRSLAKLHHPDRLMNESAEDRAASEHTMRLVNAAYLQLRSLRRR